LPEEEMFERPPESRRTLMEDGTQISA
jgi:hypothetical protein